MSATLTIRQAGPLMSVQDFGRPGYRASGMTLGGAADPLALHEGAILLGQDHGLAAIEMVGAGGIFEADTDLRIALTGATMSATLDGAPLCWNASHTLPAGAKLSIGGASAGTYGYLHVGGGIDLPLRMGARSTHFGAGLGGALKTGDALPIGVDRGSGTGNALPRDARFDGGTLRVVPSIQTDRFDAETIERFIETSFTRDARANRRGVRMDQPGAGFFASDQLSILSEVITVGDIQITGDGAPFVLLCECQTTGGYPRIGTVIPSDLPRVAQAATGANIRFEFITLEQAIAVEQRAAADLKALPGKRYPLVRDPANIRDLLSYQLVSGAVSATANPFEKET
jgi:allophanate hydrolase